MTTMNLTDFKFRNRVIYRCYQTGEFTFRALGEIFTLSGNRISQIYYRSVWRQKMRQRREQLSPNFLDFPVDRLDISVKTYHALNVLEVKCVGDVLNTDDATFMRHFNFGRRSLNELKLSVLEVAKKYKAIEVVAI